MTRPHGGNRILILDTALRLFNERGTGPVSTNHISDAAGVSPGNLYYHFRNKHELIRELYAQQTAEMGKLWAELRPTGNIFVSITAMLHSVLVVTWRYRFLAREMSSLMQQDPVLKHEIRKIYTTRRELIQPMVTEAYQAGHINVSFNSQLFDDINRLIWMVTYYWISFFDLESEDHPEDRFIEGTRLCFRTFEPYLSDEARQEVLDYLAKLGPQQS